MARNEFDVETQGQQSTSAGAADDYAAMMADGDDEVAPRQVGFPLAPPFLRYVLNVVKAERRQAKVGDGVGARAQIEIIAGPADTAGMKFFDSGNILYGFVPSRMGGKPPNQKPLTDEEFAKKVKSRRAGFNRIRQALGLATAMPSDLSPQAVDAWCAQFPPSGHFVAEIRVERGNDGVERNRVVWESVAGLNEPELDRQGRQTGKTALEVAVADIAAYDAKAAATQVNANTAASLNPNG